MVALMGIRLLVGLALRLSASPARADEWRLMGARAMGLGGAGVAAAEGPAAVYWNPAALGLAGPAYGFELPIGVHFALTGSGLEEAKNLPNLRHCTNLACLAQIDANLSKLNAPGNGLRLGVDAGAQTKIRRATVFSNTFIDMGAVPFADLINVSQGAIDNNINSSKLVIRGRQTLELGTGYGRELPVAPGLLIGANLKLLRVQAGFSEFFILRNTNDNLNMLAKLKEGSKTSYNIGLDFGALWDIDRSFEDIRWRPRLGLVARNVNNPGFKHPDPAVMAGFSERFALTPQVRLGASIRPLSWWLLAADADMTRNFTMIDGIRSRQFSVGTEITLFNRRTFSIPLRLGFTRNLEETSAGSLRTLGLGLRLWGASVDAAFAISRRSVTTESQGRQNRIPREAFAAFQAGLRFGPFPPSLEGTAPSKSPLTSSDGGSSASPGIGP